MIEELASIKRNKVALVIATLIISQALLLIGFYAILNFHHTNSRLQHSLHPVAASATNPAKLMGSKPSSPLNKGRRVTIMDSIFLH
jgi:hypothetical protein